MRWLERSRRPFALALAWYVPEEIPACPAVRWHFSWRMPLLFVLRDLMLPVIYFDAWFVDFRLARQRHERARGGAERRAPLTFSADLLDLAHFLDPGMGLI